jgi:hypothetical protein
MNEDKEKMKSLVYKLDKQGEARISKLVNVKLQLKTKLDVSSANSKFTIDFSSFKNNQQAKTVLFSSVFIISKKKISSTTITSNVILIKNFID